MKDTTSSIEALEARIAPALLSAKLVAGVLNITGDPAAATVTVTQTGGTIEVLDGAASLGTFNGTSAINFNLVGGGMVNFALTGNGLPGPCIIAAHGASVLNVISGSHLNGGLIVTGDVNAQNLNLGNDVIVGKVLALKGAGGPDAISIGNGGTIGGNLVLVSVESGSFNANSVATAIVGALKVNNAGDPLSVAIQTTQTTGVTIGRGVNYVGGALNDILFLAANITGAVKFVDTTGDNGLGFGFTSVVHGSVSMLGGVGSDGFNLQGGTIDGNVTLQLAGGNNSFNYGIGSAATIGGNLAIFAGTGNDKVQSGGGGLTVGRNVNINFGGGTNSIIASIIVSGTSLLVTTGSGEDLVSIDGMGTNVAAKISLGAGNDMLGGVLIKSVKSAVFDGGAGTDHLLEKTFVADPFIIRSFEDFS